MADEKKDKVADEKEAKFDRKWLAGLKFKSSKQREVEEDGKKVKKYFPTERSMTPEDVLSWKVYGKQVVIITADGQKITVDR